MGMICTFSSWQEKSGGNREGNYNKPWNLSRSCPQDPIDL